MGRIVLISLLILCSAIVLALLLFAILGVYISNEMFNFWCREEDDDES